MTSRTLARERWLDLAGVVVLCGAAIVALATRDDYGITWDEPVHLEYGDAVLRTLLTLGEERAGMEHRDRSYGPGYDLLGAIARDLSPLEGYPTMRLVGAAVGLLGALGVLRLGRLLAGPLGGFLSVAFVVLTPVYYGHLFANPKDLPFAAAYVWALFYIARIAKDAPSVVFGDFVKAGLFIGAALSVRIAGFVLVPLLFAVVAVRAIEHAGRRPGLGTFARDAGRWALGALLATALGYTILIALWPAAWEDPFGHPFASVKHFSKYTHFRATTLYDGRWLTTDRLPWSYMPAYFVFQMPESVLFFSGVGAIAVVARTVERLARRRALPVALGVVAVAAFGPPIAAIARDVNVYDGFRQFLFVVPAFCALAGATAAHALAWLSGHARVAAVALAALVALSSADTLRSMVSLHPYQYVHYNRILGGLPAADLRWDMDYYGLGYKEAHALLREQLWRTERERYLAGGYTVTAPTDGFFHTLQTTENFVFRPPGRPADFYVSYTRHGVHHRFGSRPPVILRVEREGVMLELVKDLR